MKFLALTAILMFASPTLLAEVNCNHHFLTAKSVQLAEEIKSLNTARLSNFSREDLAKEISALYSSSKQNYSDVSDALLNDLRQSSRLLKQKLKTIPKDSPDRTYDMIFVGAGIHTGITKSTLAKELGADFSELKILTVEASNDISVFGRLGKSFNGNTLEHSDIALAEELKLSKEELIAQSKNYQAGAGIQVADVSTSSIPIADQFQAPAVSSHWLSGGDFLFESPVDGIAKIKSQSGEVLYRVTTNGETVYTKNIVIATGLGEGKLPTIDPKSITFIKSQEGSNDQRVYFVENFLEKISRQQKAGKNFLNDYANKKIIIAGGGHGGAIGIEAIELLGPKSLYSHIKNPDPSMTPSSYLWVNLKATNGEEFKKVIGGGTRYHQLAPLLDNGKIQTNQYYIYEVLPSDKGGVKVSFLDKETKKPVLNRDGSIFYEEGDHFIYAVGYESPNEKILKSFADAEAVRFENVNEIITPNDSRLFTESPVIVAKQVYSKDGTPERIFTAGPSAGQIPHEKDPGGPTSVTMNVFGPRSEALGRKLAKDYIKEKK